ncbi:hypothetical protein C475_14503 [Halosimplex carlsbadense 2-9-1]|uniref:Uncharacterized protein n=1 Tax=Halosimplex carlsbadense 2-9-1 TaxID=797114 RepID=M0CMA1_9EURY|nr:hypothetical protein [Halosimplex carlsbadense]ELZ23492.1 hypothetical protein C475_14503 [Halosimplex carlsbadense 2-9-1]
MLPESVPVEGARLAGAVAGVLLTLYWTFERLRGEGHDPVLRMSSSSDTGSASFLASGVAAVGIVVGIVAMLVLGVGGAAPIVANPAPVLVFLALIVVAHWVVEKEESET